jgi:lysyl-tRNA synthetase class II
MGSPSSTTRRPTSPVEKQVELRKAGDEEGMYLDEDYVLALSYGMPPAEGWGSVSTGS